MSLLEYTTFKAYLKPPMHHMLSRRYRKFIDAIKELGYFTRDFAYALGDEIRASLAKWQPWILFIASAGKAVISFFSTLSTSLKIAPAILSALTVLSAIPLFHVIMPEFIFQPIIFTPALVGIAGIAAYLTYKDSIERDRLDKKIEANDLEITQLKNQLQALKTTFANHKTLLPNYDRRHNKPLSAAPVTQYALRSKTSLSH